MSTTHTCCGMVWTGYSYQTCGKKAKYERDGKWYCGTHDPVAIQAKTDARTAKWNAKWDAKESLAEETAAAAKVQAHKAACFDDLLSALRDVLENYHGYVDPDRTTGQFGEWEEVITARAAIFKATGGTA